MTNTAIAILPVIKKRKTKKEQLQQIVHNKKERIKELEKQQKELPYNHPDSLTKLQLEQEKERIRTEEIKLWETYNLSKRPLSANKIVTSGDCENLSLHEYLEALYTSTSGYQDRGGVNLMYKRNTKVLNDFAHPKFPDKFEQVDAMVNAIRMVWGINQIISHTHGRRTLYHTLNTFNGVDRVKEKISQIHANYVDIDCYNLGKTQQETVDYVNELVTQGKIPEPSFIINSGRGVYVIWLLNDVIGTPNAISYYDAIQTSLVNLFKDYGADHGAKGVNGYLRLPGSYHPKVNKRVAIVEHNVANRYNLKEVGIQIGVGVPTSPIKTVKAIQKEVPTVTKVKKKAKANQFTQFSYQDLFQKDLKQLLLLRGFQMSGHRDTWLYMMHHSLLRSGVDADLVMDRLLQYNAKFKKSLPITEVYDLVQSSFSRYCEWLRAKDKTGNQEYWGDSGKIKYKGYNWKPETVVMALDITTEEMGSLKLFVDKEIRLARKQENIEKRKLSRQQKKGPTQRETNKENNIKAVQALLEQGLKQKDIANILVLTKGRVSQIVKQIKLNSQQES